MKPMQHPFRHLSAVAAGLAALFLAGPVHAQTVNFNRPSLTRVTVPVNSTNVTVITNVVDVADLSSDVNLDITGLPPGAGYSLSTTTVSADSPLEITIYTTNIAQGEYTFSLNGTGGATNSLNFVLQSGYVWQGAGFGAAANWTNNPSWQTDNPTNNPAADIIFGDAGAQTNVFPNGISFTNILLNQSMTVGSIRFSPGTHTNDATTALFHNLNLGANVTLTVTGQLGFRILRDYISELREDRKNGISIGGGAGARLVVSNANAVIANLLEGSAGSGLNYLSMSNLQNFVAYVDRFGAGDFRLYPNYYNYVASNQFPNGIPRRFNNSLYLARTNFITALHVGPDNYTNEFTRTYGFMFQNSERFGVGSSINNFLYFGQTNRIHADSVCLIGANHANGNGGVTTFNPAWANSGAVFRNPAGTGRMTLFSVADDGGTGEAASNVKATIDFAANGGYVDILTDLFIVSRDRQLIASNQTPNVQGDVTIGRGIVDANTMILGYQEHDGKTDWTTIGGAQPYLNYCQGRLVITNGGTVRVNRNLILGYTADSNPVSSAQQYNTHGRVTVLPGSTLMASNIVVDGGPFNYDPDVYLTPRTDFITVERGFLIVSNTLGAAPGRKLQTLTLNNATNTIFVAVGRTNYVVKNLLTPGTAASVLRIAAISGVSSYPATIPIISYENASSPYLQADLSLIGGGVQGYLLDNTADKTVDLYLTTNTPNTLRWTGSVDDKWDYTTFNWVTVPGGTPTNFAIGDIVIFDDSSTRTNVTVVDSVVPGQAGFGFTVSNAVRQYTFSGGTISGTGSLLKQGAAPLIMDATKQGPILIQAGSVSGTGVLGLATVYDGAVLNFAGNVNGGLVSTGAVTIATGGQLNGPVTIAGGWLRNAGTLSTAPGNFTLVAGNVTNTATGVINWAVSAAVTVPAGSVLANHGTINNLNNRINVNGLLFGSGTIADPDGGLFGPSGIASGIDGRVNVLNPVGVITAGTNATGDIGTLTVQTRFDLSAANSAGWGTLYIEVNKAHALTNDHIAGDFWNNMGGRIVITNLNPGLPLAAGDVLWIFRNNNGEFYENKNDADAAAQPTIEPPIPGPGLQWDLSQLRGFGKIFVRATPLVWRGNVSGDWDTTTPNWLGSITFTNEGGALFDDSVGGGATTVTLNQLVAPSGYQFTTNIIPDVSTNIFTNMTASFPGIVVSNSAVNYTLGGNGSIEGITGLYKTGPGTLTILGNMTNRYTGPTIIAGGAVEVSVFTNNSVPQPLGAPGQGARAPTGSERLILDSGTLRFSGATMQSDRGMTIRAGGATLDVTNPATLLLVSGALLGDGALTKTGAGTLALSQGNNAFTNLTVAGGTLELRGAAAGRGFLALNGGNLRLTNNVTITNLLNVAAHATLKNTNTTVLGGALVGSATLAIQNYNPSRITWNASLSGFSGTLDWGNSTGTNRFNNATNANNARGSAAALFNLGTGSLRLENLNGGGLTYELGGLAGGPNTVLAGRATNNPTTSAESIYVIGGKNLDTVFDGSIVDGVSGGTVSVVKVGTGKLTLNGSHTFTGSLTVSNGTLAGNGTFAGALNVTAGGTLAPGASVGVMTVNSNVTLAGTTIMELDRVGLVSTNDRLVAPTITAGGTLLVTNIGPTLVNGTTFQLFSVPVSGFSTVTLPGAPYVWNNNLAVDGSITLVSGGTNLVDTTPTNITASVSGTTMTLSWPASHTGWSLQTQTNSAATGLGTNWVVVPGSSATNVVSITINPTNPTVFFRLVYP